MSSVHAVSCTPPRSLSTPRCWYWRDYRGHTKVWSTTEQSQCDQWWKCERGWDSKILPIIANQSPLTKWTSVFLSVVWYVSSYCLHHVGYNICRAEQTILLCQQNNQAIIHSWHCIVHVVHCCHPLFLIKYCLVLSALSWFGLHYNSYMYMYWFNKSHISTLLL